MTQREITLPGRARAAPTSGQAKTPSGNYGSIRFEHWALVPLLVFLLVLVAYPLFELVRMSFSTATPVGGDFRWSFSGLDNFRTMLADEIFRSAMRNVVVFVSVTTIVQLVLGTALALLVEQARLLSRIARNVLIWPAIVTPVAISATFWLMLNPSFGLINHVLTTLGLPTQTWLASKTWALPTLMMVDVWHWTPVVFLLVLAGLAGIDRQLYEAAKVDGASGWRTFVSITLPLLLPTLFAAAMVRVVLGFKVFDEVFLLTSGGPGTSTEVLSSRITDVFFGHLDMGYGSSLGLVVVAVLIIILSVFGAVRGGLQGR
ncbi:MAG: carbohydrate ABC transporter permease [Rubrobacter sp.]